MRSSIGLGLFLCAAFNAGKVAGQTVVDITAVSGLSTCALQCASMIAIQHDCLPSQSCFCNNTDVRAAWTECLMIGCPYSDQLEASRFQAETCDAPTRDRGQLLSIVAYVLFAIAGLCLLARIASRSALLAGPGYGWDDFMAVLCFAPLTALTVAIHFSVEYGEGRDIWTLGIEDIMRFHKWFYISSIMYVFVTFGTKLSLVLLYLRTWKDNSMFRVLCWAALLLLGAALIAFEVAVIAQCRPIASQWTHFSDSSSSGRCVDRQLLIWALAGTDLGFNVLMVVLPIRPLTKLSLTWAKKVCICLVFLAGLTVVAMSITRVFYIHGFTATFNTTYYYSFAGLYSNIEVYLSQLVCLLPGIQQLWKAASNNFSPLASKKSSRESIRISAPLHIPERHDFASIHTPREAPDLEKAEHPESTEKDYVSDDESAPPPVVHRSSHNSFAPKHRSSFEPIIERIEPQRSTFRSSATTAARNSAITASRSSAITASRSLNNRASTNDMREPDIMYHDHQNRLRLEIHDPPDQPITAQLQYVDRNEGVHDLELMGRPRESSTRPNTAPSPSYSTTNYSDSSISTDSSAAGAPIPPLNPRLSLLQPDLPPWSKDRPPMDDRSKSEEEKLADLANAHAILTEEGMSSSHTLSDI